MNAVSSRYRFDAARLYNGTVTYISKQLSSLAVLEPKLAVQLQRRARLYEAEAQKLAAGSLSATQRARRWHVPFSHALYCCRVASSSGGLAHPKRPFRYADWMSPAWLADLYKMFEKQTVQPRRRQQATATRALRHAAP